MITQAGRHGDRDVAATDLIVVTPVWLRADAARVRDARRLLTPDERDRADRFRTPELHDRFVLARACLRILLARTLGVGASRLRFDYSDAGKPLLRWPISPLAFNVSHSHELAVYALSQATRRLGIDIEKHRWHDELDDVARRFFSPAECADLREYRGEERIAAFYRCWARKEAYIKGVGTGLQIALDSFQVSLGDPARLVVARDDDASRWHMRALAVAQGFEGAVAYDGTPAKIRIEDPTTAEAVVADHHLFTR